MNGADPAPRADGTSGTEPLTIRRLEDWVRAGAHWRVVHHSERRVVVEMQQCTGEPVERLSSGEPALIAYLEGAGSDLDLAAPGGDRGPGAPERSGV